MANNVLYIYNMTTYGFEYHMLVPYSKTQDLRKKIELLRRDPSYNEYTPTEKDKIFLMPEADIPKFKVKPLCDKYKLHLVKDKTKADHVFISDNYWDKIHAYRNYYSMIRVDISRFKKLLNDSTTIFGKNVLNDPVIKAYIEDPSNTEVYMYSSIFASLCDDPDYRRSNPVGAFIYPGLYKNAAHQGVSGKYYTLARYEEMLNASCIQNMKNCITLVPYCNEENVITKEKYETLKKLLSSNDRNDNVVALEAMANCDYDKSIGFLLLLIKEYSATISLAPNVHNKNVACLFNYFDLVPGCHISVDHLMDTLIQKKSLDYRFIESFMDYLYEKIDNNMPTNKLVVKEIGFKPEVEAAFEVFAENGVEIVKDEEEVLNLQEDE